jgi:hypothetical protein
MKKATLMVAAALVVSLASIALAEEAVPAAAAEAACCACPPDPTVTGDVYVGPVSKYLFRGNSLSPNDTFVIQGGVDLTYKAVTFSYWTNFQNRKAANPETGTTYSRGKVTENDLILDYAIPYKLPFADKLKFNIGTQYFALDGSNDTNEFYFKAAVETLLNPTFTVYWDNMAATRAGLFYTAAISHKVVIERNLLGLNLGGLISYNQRNPSAAWNPQGDGIYNGWHNYELSASVDYTPTANLTISPTYLFSNAMSGFARNIGITDRNVFGIKAMFTF